jgi:transcriptional regulator with PAS, ATPase and Fis domain
MFNEINGLAIPRVTMCSKYKMKDIRKLSLAKALQHAKANPPQKSTLLRDEIDRIILAALEKHSNGIHVTARYLGITPKTMWRWKQRYEKRRLEGLKGNEP